MTKAVYAGSFDPLTKGHQWMIEQGSGLFDELVVAIGKNPGKMCMFSLDERVKMAESAASKYKNVKVDQFEKLYLVDYAKSIDAGFLLRGIRPGDMEYERIIRNVNEEFNPGISTVFLMPPRELADISSTLVKSFIGFEGWQEKVRKYIPVYVYGKMLEKVAK